MNTNRHGSVVPAPQGAEQAWSLSDDEVGYIAGALMFRVEELERVGVLGFYGGVVELRARFIAAAEGPSQDEGTSGRKTVMDQGAGEPAAGEAEKIGLIGAPTR